MLDSLKFWKHEEQPVMPNLGERPSEDFEGIGSFDFNQGITKPPSLEPAGAATISTGMNAPAPPSAFAQPASLGTSQQNTELQLISTKLDTIKALLDNVSARLARIEQMADEASKETAQPTNKPPTVRWNYQ
ncbi:MAG: hypothetical protein Q7K43_01830 [Candidatus Woesearchaeota archaeon]|nr:hypothetical protein [Candidatus Woesearchaeota archaeon]